MLPVKASIMSTIRASTKTVSRAFPRAHLQPLPRSVMASRRTYTNEKTPAQATSSGVTPLALGGAGLGVVAILYFLSSNQKDVAKSDHKGQESYRTDKPEMHNVSVKDINTNKDPSQSDLPNDAPNNPANLDKMEQKQSQKPASKRSNPMQ